MKGCIRPVKNQMAEKKLIYNTLSVKAVGNAKLLVIEPLIFGKGFSDSSVACYLLT